MHNDNPFAAPAESHYVEAPVIMERKLRIATTGKRFVNMLIDQVFLRVITTFASVFVVSLELEEDVEILVDILVSIPIFLSYFIFTEYAWGKTPAKFMTGTRVVNKDGGTPTFGQIVGRTFARLIPFEAFSFFGGNGHPRGWHDSLSGTSVVMD